MKFRIIALLAVSLLIVGCIEKLETSPESTTSKQIIPGSYVEIRDKILSIIDCKQMTTLQCNNLRNSYNGKYVKWDGIVEDVRNDDLVYVKMLIGEYNPINKQEIPRHIILHDITNKTLLTDLNIGQKVSFIGQIKTISDYGQEWNGMVPLDLYNAEITETVPQPTQVPIKLPEIK